MYFSHLPHPEGRPKARVYVFPHAGGSISDYLSFGTHTRHVELVGVQLPGRGVRFSEPSITSVTDLAAEIASGLPDGLPFGFFGHSFGSLLAFETCRALRRQSAGVTPSWLWISAFPPPDRSHFNEALHSLPGPMLLRELAARYGAIPAEVLENPELRDLVDAYVRADYRALETYEFTDEPALGVPIVVLAPADDRTPIEEMSGWRRHTDGEFQLHEFGGRHFYLRSPENLERICEIITSSVVHAAV